MSRTKCSNCGLVNLVGDLACPRCGGDLTADVPAGKPGVTGAKPAGRPISPFVVVGVLLCVIAFTAFGVWRAVNKVAENDKKRIEAQTRSRNGIDNERPDEMQNVAANGAVVDQQRQIDIVRRALNPNLDNTQKATERLKQFTNQSKQAAGR